MTTSKPASVFLQVFIICILSDEKYQHFQDVLTTYIEKHFSAALAHKYVKHNSDLFVANVCYNGTVKIDLKT